MAQNNSEISGEIKEFIVAPSSYEIQMPICDKTVTCDVTGDFVLPDYLPEIKRLLRVTPAAAESSKYISGGAAEFAGAVNYTVLYANNDGRLFCAPLSSDYDFECKLGDPETEFASDSVFCDTYVESVNCRPVGPRKLVIKSRLLSRVRAYENRTIPERTVGALTAEDEFSIERLKRDYPTARLIRGKGDEISVGGEIALDSTSGGAKPIFCEGKVAILDASLGDGEVGIRAELNLDCLLEKEDGEVFKINKRFPVSDTVELNGAGRDFDCRAWGICSSVEVNANTSEEDHRTKLVCDASVVFEAEAAKNVPASVSEDAYSTLCDCECTIKEYELPFFQRAVCTTFSFSHSIPLTEAGVSAGDNIIDICGDAKVEKVENAHGKYTASGVCRASALISGEEAESTEFDFPFKYEFDGDEEAVTDFEAVASVVSMRARIEGENVALDGEMALALSVFGKNRANVADTLTLNKNAPYSDDRAGTSIVVFYPDKGDSLWSVAKKYHVPLSTLEKNNEPRSGDIASFSSLSGRDFIIFEK